MNTKLIITKSISKNECGQILVEALTALATFLLFIIFAVQICEETMLETRHARITHKEKHGIQNTRYTHPEKIPAHYHRDIHGVFSSRKYSR